MTRTLRIAAVQMHLAPAPLPERLARAERLIASAVAAGAQLVVLPEFFNTGYTYADSNYALAEPITGTTVTWMMQQAAQHRIHLSGTLMLVDGLHVYNTALLIAPDGRRWRYDKRYPFGWERAFFREGAGITVAETDLGRLGLMICWDSAHADLWQRYAGQVQAMLIPSCPPKMHRSAFILPDGTRLNIADIAPYEMTDDAHFAERYIDEQAAWLGVPVVHTSGTGTFRSPLPAALPSMLAMLASRPRLWHHLRAAIHTELEAETGAYTKIVGADGEVLARVTQDGDSFTLAHADLPDAPPQPQGAQPATRTPAGAFIGADVLATLVSIPLYQRGVRQQWGRHMAPPDARTRLWLWGLLAACLVGLMLKLRRRV